jgi:SAM-dependent methyltransferase
MRGNIGPEPGVTGRGAIEVRGVDGVTVAELRRGRAEWWDAAFTALLLEHLPAAPIELVDLGCGTAHAAHALLAERPAARYLGIDIDAERVALCQPELARWGERARAIVGDAAALPLADRSCDVVLTVCTLEHVHDVPRALGEIRRVLRAGGRLIAAEPDNLCQMLRFDGLAAGLDESFEALFAKLVLRRAPADLALGPKLGALLGAAGFGEVSMRVHLVQSVHEERIEQFVERLSGVVTTIAGAGALRDDEPECVAVRRRLAAIESDLRGRSGFSLHAVPMWRWVATRTG